MSTRPIASRKRAPRTKILLVDDHPIVRHGLSMLIRAEPDMSVVGEAEDANQALAAIRTHQPDIVLVDLTLKGASGLELIKAIKTQYPQLPALVLSMHDEMLYAERALHAGARGYVMKQQAVEQIAPAIRNVLKGQIHLSENIINKALKRFAQGEDEQPNITPENLSDRELEVLRLTGQGYGASEQAERLHLSVKTIESHRDHIKKKLGLDSAAELTRYAIEWAKTHMPG